MVKFGQLQKKYKGKNIEMVKINEKNLRMRRNKEFLWVSAENKKIYLKAQESCLALYFAVYEEMTTYIHEMIKKGYAVG